MPVRSWLVQTAPPTDKDRRRQRSLYVSNCKISPPDDDNLDACTQDAIATWVDANQSELEAH